MVEPKTIVLMLKTQNPGLRTDEWNIIQQRPEPLGTSWIFEIDESSRKNNLKAVLGITSVSFRILGGIVLRVKGLKLIQGNLQHSRAASATLCHTPI